ncbi:MULTISPECIES: DUF2061 domain-containing protein [Flavobacteriaceae]|uniref:DUF2061 domain-containing protein n=2 Tax=Flavobacteriaceae TaxID=49546 RepID=A0A4Y8AUK0_9FLAO|nr:MULTISPECIES: DUF2061 domain-containing protein [Flavobacteriaceae]TEW75050.1 DUF2061 domain-containing protein [Gramella jeungdoensis]GGK41998.1 hypothetical protein GCM10007963_07530 [Lutibacter litoralis]
MILDQIFISNKKQNKSGEVDVQSSEKPMRSILKTISWRVIGTLDTIVISWLITGHIALALSIGSIELVTKMVLYFFHERIWNKIKWGK